MERHSIELWDDTSHDRPPRRYWLNVPVEAWPNQPLSEPETYAMSPEQIIKIQSRKIERLEVEVFQAVTERDRLRKARIFRHFELYAIYGSLAVILAVLLVCGIVG